MTRLNLLICALFVCATLYAQQIPVMIQGATIHLGNGQVILNGTIAFDSGKIVFVDSVMRNSYKNARIVNGTGKHVYPGLILLNTYLGLNEIDAVRATRDYNETGEMNPNVRTLIAYNTDSKVVPTAKYNGIAYMQVIPTGGLVSGTSCVVKTEAQNWEDAAVVAEDGIHVNWPEMNYYNSNKAEQQKNKDRQIALLNELMELSKQYQFNSKTDEINLRLQAMQGILTGKKVMYMHANSPMAILEALAFIKNHQLTNAALVTGSEAYLVVSEIKASNVPVIVNLIHSLPTRNHSDVDQPYKTVAQLMQAGILTAIGHSGSWESRNVMFNAGTCAAYGITPEEALQLITQNAARICGANNIGTLEPGKTATLIVTDGDVLDMKSANISMMFMDGQETNLTNGQTELYKKYSERYKLNQK